MENDTAASSQDGEAPRRSGRVVKAPEKWEPEASAQTASAKRKRDGEDGDGGNDDIESDEGLSDEEDAESDEDHPAPRSRRAGGASRQKPSLKKPKINGGSAVHTARIPSRPKKTVRIDAGNKGTGLFGIKGLPITNSNVDNG